jgi:hypothetical protein
MYNRNNLTFTTTLKKSEETKDMSIQLELLGKGYKKRLIERIIISIATLSKLDKRAVEKICNGKFKITLL